MNDTDQLRLRFDLFDLDEQQARLTRAGQALALAPKVFGVLCALARRPGQLVSKDALLDEVWGHAFVSDSVLKTCISELRAALGDDARQPRYIETAARRGYRFIAPLVPGIGPGVAPPIASQPVPRISPPIAAVDLPIPVHPVDAPPPTARDASAARHPNHHLPAAPLTGRGAALAELHAAWRAALSGQRQVVWLAGEAGIGKTTLIEHFAAGLGPGTVAHGQCVEQHGAGEPYLPVLQALAGLCDADPALPPLLRSVAPTWLLQMPWLASEAELAALRHQLAGSGQERMLRELGELLDRCTQQRPLLLVTEDLHWSDHATLRLMDHVVRRRGPARLVWLASFRLAEVVAGDHPLKVLRHELKLHRLVHELVLDPFSEREVADYLAGRFAAQPVPEALARTLHARTDGLPLFLSNVVDELVSQGLSEIDALAAAATRDSRVPESLAGVIERQIARLSDDERMLLEAASVCGTEFHAGTAAAALGREAAWAAGLCDELARRQQWLVGQGIERLDDGSMEVDYRFRHALYRQVFYQRCGALARAQLHARVADAMRRRPPSRAGAAAELALHFERGHDPANAVRHYAEAAESALRHFAPTEAMQLTSHALGLLQRCADGPGRLELEMAVLGPRTVAASQVLGVTAPETREAFERLEDLCEQMPQGASRALEMGLGWALFVCGEFDRALQLAQRKHALAERRGDRVLKVAACNLSGAVSAYQGQMPAAREWLERGLEACVGLGEQLASALAVVDLEVSIRSRFSQVLGQLGEIGQARRQLASAQARAERTGQPYTRRLVLIYECLLEVQLDHPPRVQALAGSLQHIATGHAMAQAEGAARWLRGWALARMGQPDEGHRLIVEGYELDVRIGMLRGRSGVLGYAAAALAAAGRWEPAQRALDEARALAARMGERIHLPDLLLLQSDIALGQGKPDLARDAMRAALREASAQEALWPALKALVALCSMPGTGTDDGAALAEVRAKIREGADTPLIARADELLAGRSRADD